MNLQTPALTPFLRHVLCFEMTAVALLAMSACGGDDPAPPRPDSSPAAAESVPSPDGPLSVRGTDFAFEGTAAIAAGSVTLRFSNDGEEGHELHVMRLDDGVTAHQFNQTLHQDGQDAALDMASTTAHVAEIEPGDTADVTADLAAGEYFFLCLVESPADDTSHAIKGMVKAVTVPAATSAS